MIDIKHLVIFTFFFGMHVITFEVRERLFLSLRFYPYTLKNMGRNKGKAIWEILIM